MPENKRSAFQNRHPQYLCHEPLVKYYRDHYEGGPLYPSTQNPLPSAQAASTSAGGSQKVPDGSGHRYGATNYLWQYPLERGEKYVHRLARAVYVNIVAPVVDFYVATIGKPENAVIDPNGTELEEFLSNADGQGQTFAQVMAAARVNATVAGHTFLYVDTPAAASEPVTQRDAQEMGLRPYVCEILREDMLNWRLDRLGKPIEILYRVRGEVAGSVLDPDAAGAVVEYRYVTPELWQVWIETKDGFVLLAEGPNRAGKIPIVCLYHRRKSTWDGESLLKDAAKYAQLLTNWVSGFDESLESSMFPVPIWKSRKSPTDEGVGSSTLLHLNPDEGEEFLYVSPDTAPFEAGWAAFAMMVTLANKHMGITSKPLRAEGSANDPQSGVSKEWDFTETEKVLVSMSVAEQDAVLAVLDLVCEAMGSTWTGTVQYATKFDLSTATENIENLVQLQAAGAPPIVQQRLMMLAVNKIITSMPGEVAEEIRNEIAKVQGPPAQLLEEKTAEASQKAAEAALKAPQAPAKAPPAKAAAKGAAK